MAKTTEKKAKVEVKPVEAVAEVKAVATKAVEEVKAVAEETKETVKKAATKKAAEKKTVEKKTAEKKTAEKKSTEKKTAEKKTAKSQGTSIFVQYQNQQQTTEVIVERIKAQYEAEGNKVSGIKSLNIYIKPEDGQAYYVINDKVAGAVSLF